MVSIKNKLTLQKFLDLPTGDINYELVNGYAIPKVSPKYFHSTLQSALLLLIHTWCKGKGRVVSEWTIILQRQGENWVPVPDLTYISYQRLPKSWKRNEACPIAPELVIEIISPGQTSKQFADKTTDYFKAGVSRVWVVDPETVSIEVFSTDSISQIYIDTMPIIDTFLPGLELTVNKVFEEAGLM
ncbi:MAG: Uma2 family endonuclease [Rubrobacter sp.]|nr:Uma2 family endonuclease [Rubrobacter sp.]